MPNQDPGYKSLFSHPELVRDLLLGFVHEPWVAEVELATLERVNGSYVSDDLRTREDDVVWRVRFRDRWPDTLRQRKFSVHGTRLDAPDCVGSACLIRIRRRTSALSGTPIHAP